MAKVKNHNDEPPNLIISKDKARQSIELQIEKGRSIRDDNINSEAEFGKIKEAYSRWSSYNLELLKRIFSNDSIAKEYNMIGFGVGVISYGKPPIQKEIAGFKEKMGKKINLLESIKERLELIPEKGVVYGTTDDIGYPNDSPKAVENRARQNVILELGYFMGKLGRGNVCALYKSGVAIPSDYSGVLYIEMDDKGAWKLELAKEIKHAGIDVDLNKAI